MGCAIEIEIAIMTAIEIEIETGIAAEGERYMRLRFETEMKIENGVNRFLFI